MIVFIDLFTLGNFAPKSITMELKEFIKGVISDITNAVKECQDELDNGAIICPTSHEAKGSLKTNNGNLVISDIDFEVSLSVSSSNEDGGKINVVTALINGGVGVESKRANEDISKVKFSIPVVYPYVEVVQIESKTRASSKMYVGRT